MKTRPGFTLAELVLAVFIFGFMMTSLATIYSTSSRNMFQNYRANVVKTNVSVAMRAIQNTLGVATRIDVPTLPGSIGDSGNVLAFATNVDQGGGAGQPGCYPVCNTAACLAVSPPAWHYFCIAPDPVAPLINDLYYHTGPIAGGTGCDSAAPTTWNGPYPAFCGTGGGGTVMILMQAAVPNPVFFSRRPLETVMVKGVGTITQGVTEQDTVRVMLRSFWSPDHAAAGSSSGSQFQKSQREVDFTMDTVVKVNKSAW